MKLKVGIIGAGMTGLAAAYELSKLGHIVTVYERAPFIGGQASTFEVNNVRLERGYHHLFVSDIDIVSLMEEVGLSANLMWCDSKVGTLYDGKIYNFVTPIDLLKFTPLSLINRVRLGVATLYLKYKQNWQDLESITADEWLKKNVGQKGYQVFWEPMLRGKFGNQYFREISMAWIWGKIHTRFASRGKSLSSEKLGYPYGSFGEIFDVLAQKIENLGGCILKSSSVRNIVTKNGEVTGIYFENTPADWISPQPIDTASTSNSIQTTQNNKESKQTFEEFDVVISTTPSDIFHRLLPELPSEYTCKLKNVNYMTAVLLILVLKHPLSDVYWLNVADRSIPFVGVVEQTNMIAPEYYGGKHLVYLTNYVNKGDPICNMEPKELLQKYLPHLRKINPDFDISWIDDSYYQKIDAAQPIIGLNYSSRIPDHRTPVKGVYLANTTQIYPEDRGTNYSVKIGREVSGMVMHDYPD